MARVATAGTSSCATVAVGGIKTRGNNAISDNEAYLEDKGNYKLYDSPRGEMSVNKFYSNIIYPTRQDLGESRDMPFDMLMDHIDKSSLATKHISLVLNESQYTQHDQYWAKRAFERGFRLVDKSKNTIGSMNYVFVRNNNRRPIDERDQAFV